MLASSPLLFGCGRCFLLLLCLLFSALVSGRSHTLLCSPPSLSSSGCVLSLSCVGCSRLASCRRALGQVRPSSPLSAFVLPLLPYLLACSLSSGRRPHHHFCLRQKPPFRSASPGLSVRLPKLCWLVGLVVFLCLVSAMYRPPPW